MSTIEAQPKLTAIKGGKQTFRTVEVVRRVEHDRWDLVEAVEQDIESRLPEVSRVREKVQGAPSELYGICDEIADAIRAEGAEPLRAKTVAQFYRVAQAWPPQDRVKGASYGAHERLFARGDRVARLEKLVQRASDGRVNRNDVDLWLSGLKSAKYVSFLDGIEQAVRSALINKGKPWNKVAADDRDQIAGTLRAIANEIEAGTFGVKR